MKLIFFHFTPQVKPLFNRERNFKPKIFGTKNAMQTQILTFVNVGFKTFFLYLLSFFPSLARAGLVEELRHLYVVVILWSGACARSKILR